MTQTQTQDYAALLQAERIASNARKAELRNAAKKAGISVGNKTRRLAAEVVRSFGSVQVRRWLTAILPSSQDAEQIAAAMARLTEAETLLASVGDNIKPHIQLLVDERRDKIRILQEKAAGGGVLSASEAQQMNVLAINAIKSGKASPLAIARLVESFVDTLPTAGVQK